MAEFIFLGTGTSSGVPIIGCHCEVCSSIDPKDKRTRSSGFLITDNNIKILIDIGPDFRFQALNNNIEWIDAILITHSHQDHIGGIDELRQINNIINQSVPIYGNLIAIEEIKTRFNYIFKKTQEGGGKPKIDLFVVNDEFSIFSLKNKNEYVSVLPINIYHGEIPIYGYRIKDFTYITDASFIDNNNLNKIKGTKILVINALRFKPHPTHFNLDQALDIISIIKPEKAFLIHLTDYFLHERDQKLLPENVYFAYDGLRINF